MFPALSETSKKTENTPGSAVDRGQHAPDVTTSSVRSPSVSSNAVAPGSMYISPSQTRLNLAPAFPLSVITGGIVSTGGGGGGAIVKSSHPSPRTSTDSTVEPMPVKSGFLMHRSIPWRTGNVSKKVKGPFPGGMNDPSFEKPMTVPLRLTLTTNPSFTARPPSAAIRMMFSPVLKATENAKPWTGTKFVMKTRKLPSGCTTSVARMTSAKPGSVGAGVGAGAPSSGIGRGIGIGSGTSGVGVGAGSGLGTGEGIGSGGNGGNGTKSWHPITNDDKGSGPSPKTQTPTAHILKPMMALELVVKVVSVPTPAGITPSLTKNAFTLPRSFTATVMFASAARPPVALTSGTGVVGEMAKTIFI
mmetsp:Transcript_4799/g.17270  ORF Transcript_4799/g.17270 Transcript_4799/m.17270 type:complete len:360 (-) Transcript_4799:1548-2627(-)